MLFRCDDTDDEGVFEAEFEEVEDVKAVEAVEDALLCVWPSASSREIVDGWRGEVTRGKGDGRALLLFDDGGGMVVLLALLLAMVDDACAL